MAGHSTPVSLAPGQRVGPFVLLAPLGSGGSGRVWAAARIGRLGFSKRLALKVLRGDKLSSLRARRRFEEEARLGAQLSHPNLRAVHDLGSHEGRPFMALRWVETSLEELLQQSPGRRLPPEVVCWFGIQCCDALTAAHGFTNAAGHVAPVVHRDVSPGNILLTAQGHVLLSDLAGSADRASSPGERPSGAEPDGHSASPPGNAFFGSLGYASPEALKQEALDGRADLFSLGCVLYEALSGAPPFDGESEHALVFQVLEQGAPDLRGRAPELPETVIGVVARAMARAREARYDSAAALGRALGACVAGRSAFELEEMAAASIRSALGEKIRAREEAMYRAYERYSRARAEQTDTLPITDAALPSLGSATLHGTLARTDAVSARESARDDRQRSKGRGMFWLSLLAGAVWVAGLVGSGVYVWWVSQRRPALEAAANGAAPSVPGSAVTLGVVVAPLEAKAAPEPVPSPPPPLEPAAPHRAAPPSVHASPTPGVAAPTKRPRPAPQRPNDAVPAASAVPRPASPPAKRRRPLPPNPYDKMLPETRPAAPATGTPESTQG
jgi:serine/threonine protein kinase